MKEEQIQSLGNKRFEAGIFFLPNVVTATKEGSGSGEGTLYVRILLAETLLSSSTSKHFRQWI